MWYSLPQIQILLELNVDKQTKKKTRVWLGGSVAWSIVPYSKRLWVSFPIRARMGGNLSMFLSHIHVSLSLSLFLSLSFSTPLSQINKYPLVRIKKQAK